MTNRFQKFAFSVNSTRPHDTDTVAFSNLSTLEIVFESLRFHRKRYIVFVWTGHENATKCLRFQMKRHPCGWGLRFSLGLGLVSGLGLGLVFFGSFRVRAGVRVRFWLGPNT